MDSEPGRVLTNATVGRCRECECEMAYPKDDTFEYLDSHIDEYAMHFPYRAIAVCPNCHNEEVVRLGYTDKVTWESIVKKAHQDMNEQLKTMDLFTMRIQIERFVEALSGDQILPMDFHA